MSPTALLLVLAGASASACGVAESGTWADDPENFTRAWGVETPEDVAKVIRSALRFVPPERLHPCTNCGMVPLPRDVARAKLEALGAGAALVRAELG